MTGAAAVLCFGVLIAIVTIDAVSYQAREAMLAAQRQIPALASQYELRYGTLDGVDDYFAQRLSPLPVRTHTMFGPWPIMMHGGPHGPPEANVFVRMLMQHTRPLDVQYGGAHTVVFPARSLFERFLAYYAGVMAIVTILVIFISWRIAMAVAANSLEPLLRTTAALNRFGDGDFTPATVSTNETSEVGELAQAYNRAVRQITRALDERAQASAEMRQFVADAGHQLRTPLTVVLGYLSSMSARGVRESDGAHVATMLAQSRRMKVLIDDLITLARLEDVAPLVEGRFDVNEIVRELPDAFAPEAARRLTVEVDPRPIYVRGAPAEFREALVAVADNALKYGGGGPVTIAVERQGAERTIAIRDRGPGFSTDDLRLAFDRFYRGSASAGTSGTGLGLAIAAKAVSRAGGTIALANLAGGGAECTIRLGNFQDGAAPGDLQSPHEQELLRTGP